MSGLHRATASMEERARPATRYVRELARQSTQEGTHGPCHAPKPAISLSASAGPHEPGA
jgi:hypothetical protein